MSTFASRAAALKATLSANAAERLREEAQRQQIARVAAMPPDERRRFFLGDIRHRISTAKHWPKKPDPAIVRDPLALGSGWLLPFLLDIDDLLWGRWDYWCRTKLAGQLLDEPIPLIDFCHEGGTARNPCRRMLEAALDSIPRSGCWQTWGSWQYVDYFFDWLLYGFGEQKEPPREPEEGAFSRLYQVFCLEAMQAWPYDYFGDLLAEQQHGRSQGFYPTPHTIVDMMVRMKFDGSTDHRTESVCDPAIGTGRMILFSSNYSLSLHGQDINATCVKATMVNLFLYAPWGARPLSFLK